MKIVRKIVENPLVKFTSLMLSVLGVFLPIFVQNTTVKYIACAFCALYLICITVYLLNRYFSLTMIKNNLDSAYKQKRSDIFTCMTKAIHDTSTTVADLKTVSNDKHFKSLIKALCSSFRCSVKDIFGVDASICVKEICTDSFMNTDKSKWKTKTIARDCVKVERAKYDNRIQNVSDNTSFLSILENNSELWSSPNLEITSKSSVINYRNPDPDYSKYYRSTIVAPVRIETEYVNDVIKSNSSKDVNENSYHYLGFLCVDFEKNFDESDSNFQEIGLMTRCFSELLYSILENRIVDRIESV